MLRWDPCAAKNQRDGIKPNPKKRRGVTKKMALTAIGLQVKVQKSGFFKNKTEIKH